MLDTKQCTLVYDNSMSLSLSHMSGACGPWGVHELLKRAVRSRNTKVGVPYLTRPTLFSHFALIARATGPLVFWKPFFKALRWHGIPRTREAKSKLKRKKKSSSTTIQHTNLCIRCGVCALIGPTTSGHHLLAKDSQTLRWNSFHKSDAIYFGSMLNICDKFVK